MNNQSHMPTNEIEIILKEISSLKNDLISATKTTNLLIGFLFCLTFINLIVLMYTIFKVYSIEHNIIDYFQNFLKFHTRVIRPSVQKSESRSDSFENDDLMTSSKLANDLTMVNVDDYVYDYEYCSNSQFREEYEIPRTATKASFEHSGYSKNNSVLKSKIDRRIENKFNMKKEKSNDSICLKMKRSESWDAKNRVYTK